MALPEHMIRVSFSIDKEVHDGLKEAVYRDNTSMSKIINELARNYITLSKRREAEFNLKLQNNG